MYADLKQLNLCVIDIGVINGLTLANLELRTFAPDRKAE